MVYRIPRTGTKASVFSCSASERTKVQASSSCQVVAKYIDIGLRHGFIGTSRVKWIAHFRVPTAIPGLPLPESRKLLSIPSHAAVTEHETANPCGAKIHEVPDCAVLLVHDLISPDPRGALIPASYWLRLFNNRYGFSVCGKPNRRLHQQPGS